MTDILRPIIGIENRTAQEVFDMMSDRFRSAHRPVEQEAVAWQVRTSDGFGGFLTDTYPHNGKQLIRQGYTVTPLGPLAASPPSRALSQDERTPNAILELKEMTDAADADWNSTVTIQKWAAKLLLNILQPEGQS